MFSRRSSVSSPLEKYSWLAFKPQEGPCCVFESSSWCRLFFEKQGIFAFSSHTLRMLMVKKRCIFDSSKASLQCISKFKPGVILRSVCTLLKMKQAVKGDALWKRAKKGMQPRFRVCCAKLRNNRRSLSFRLASIHQFKFCSLLGASNKKMEFCQ